MKTITKIALKSSERSDAEQIGTEKALPLAVNPAEVRHAAVDMPHLVEAAFNLFVAADYLRGQFDSVCTKHGISHTQYNVLRILQRAYPEGHSRCEIIDRLVERAPDTTRLIDRLEQQGYVERIRSLEDRRLSIARITHKGLNILDEITPCFESVWQELTCKVSRAESLMLAEICEKIYAGGYCKEVRIEM